MKILVVGSGGREHAVIKSLKKNTQITKLYAAPGNGGISRDAECVPIKAADIQAMTDFAVSYGIDFVVVAPDDPLALGMVDALNEKGIRCFGPNKAAARIESSKVFSKNLMKKYGIPTAAYETFEDAAKAKEYAKSASYPLWIKTDGLALGKGALFAANTDEAEKIIDSLMIQKTFGDSGSRVVIEENMEGPEVTVLAFTDGKTIKPMVSSMDHKRAFDGDKGPNTGGMGVIAPNPFYTHEIAKICEEAIFLPTISAMAKEGCPFKGCLYFGLMLTSSGPKVIEYNCRFGDPEAQAVLSLLDTDLLEIMQAVTCDKLADIDIKWKDARSACVILASGGYPSGYETGKEILGLDKNGELQSSLTLDPCPLFPIIYHSGTRLENDAFYTAGGRVLGITGIGSTLKEALEIAYKAAEKINFEGKHYRKDIGQATLDYSVYDDYLKYGKGEEKYNIIKTRFSNFNIAILNNSVIEIQKYYAHDKDLEIPESINGLPVIAISGDGCIDFSYVIPTNITLPNSITHIGYLAFAYIRLSSIKLPDSVKYIGYGAFKENLLSSIMLPDSITHIDRCAFSGNRLTSLTLPDSITHIGDSAFSGNQLTNLTIPDSITYIGNGAFSLNRLENITIPNDVDIQPSSFYFSVYDQYVKYRKKKAVFNITLTDYNDNFGIAVINNSVVEIISYYGSNTDVVIPDSIDGLPVIAIGNYAIPEYIELTSIIIPNGIKYIGNRAFFGNKLTSLTLPNSIIHIEEGAFIGNQITSLTLPNSIAHIGDWAFKGNRLTSLMLPNSITHIGNYAFSYNKLTSLELPNSIIYIGKEAFEANRLTSVVVPNSVIELNPDIFDDDVVIIRS